MSCEQFHSKVGPYVDGELPAGERDEVEEHLRACTGCSEMATSFRKLDALAGGGSAPAVAADEWSRMLDDIKRGHRVRAARGAGVHRGWLLAVGSLAALLALAFVINPEQFLAPAVEDPGGAPSGSTAAGAPTGTGSRIAELEDYVEIIHDGTDPEALTDIDIEIIDEGEGVEGAPHLRFTDF